MKRLQTDRIKKDLSKKIVFLVGPRQVGKTWLAKEIGKQFHNSVYLNYDHASDREIIHNESWLDKTDLVIFDELHKMPLWKNYLKGVFDTKSARLKILVTGSARLDFLRQSGDSLAGRFFTHRLMPLSVKEISETTFKGDIARLMERGGFPEPFLAEESVDANRWRQQYIDGLIRTDIHEVDTIHDLRSMQLLLSLLQQRVGSPVSFTSLARDIGVSPGTILKYVQILESLYIVFRITPYAHNIARSLLKEPKIYFFDTGMVDGNDGLRFENMVALSLVKHAYALNDYNGEPWTVQYLRTKDGREVDFCLVRKNRIESAIEAKISDSATSPHLQYFCKNYSLKGIQLVLNLKQEKKAGAIEIRKAKQYLEELFL